MSKKSYNPFKMWGSWVGAIIPLIYKVVFDYFGAPVTCTLQNECSKPSITYIISELFRTVAYGGESNFEIFPPIYFTIGGIILGFLAGWGIHSLIRKLRR